MESKTILKWLSVAVVGVSLIWYVFQLDAKASDAKAKADKHDKAMVNIEQIANNMTALHFILRNYLLLHQVDTLTASAWSKYYQGAQKDSEGNFLLNVPFLAKKVLPELGILGMLKSKDDTVKIFMLDTLWDFRSKDE